MRQSAAPHKELRADIDKVAEQNLPFFEFRPVQSHREEKITRELPAETGHSIQGRPANRDAAVL
jgi:hypothetical protein